MLVFQLLDCGAATARLELRLSNFDYQIVFVIFRLSDSVNLIAIVG